MTSSARPPPIRRPRSSTTWGFKKEYYELSLKLAKPLFDAIATAGAPTAATDCPLAALQIEQGTGRKPKHPIEILATAYGLEE